MKKKILIVSSGILVAFAAACIIAARQPSTADVHLVRGIDPVCYVEVPGAQYEGQITRKYSLQVPFDEAVRRLQEELTANGWTESITYDRAYFTKSGEQVDVERGRVYEGSPLFLSDPSLISPASYEAMDQLFASATDVEQWSLITTRRNSNRLTTKLAGIRMFLGGGPKCYVRICKAPKKGTRGLPIDMSKGTKHMESDRLNMGFFTGTN